MDTLDLNIDIEKRMSLYKQIQEQHSEIKNPEKIIHNMAMENLLCNVVTSLRDISQSLHTIDFAISTNPPATGEDIDKAIPDYSRALAGIEDVIIRYSGCN